jgi:hypothetical protein
MTKKEIENKLMGFWMESEIDWEKSLKDAHEFMATPER